MSIVQSMSVLALRQILPGLIGNFTGGAADAAVNHLFRHFSDNSGRYLQALEAANDRAWKALEIGLAGDSFWEQCKGFLASGEDKAFRQHVQALLEMNPVAQMTSSAELRKRCLAELKQARERQLLSARMLNAQELARRAASFARYAEPAQLTAEQNTIRQVIEELRKEKCPNLAALVSQQVQGGTPLIIVAVRYFFRRQVETDAELARGLTFSQLDHLNQSQLAAFQTLNGVLIKHGHQLEKTIAMLANLQGGMEVIIAKENEQSQQLARILQELERLKGQLGVDKAARPGLSIRNDQELQLVKNALARYRNVPEQERKRASVQQVNLVGKMELEAGELGAAERTFVEAAQKATDPAQKAEAHYNGYRVALEKQDWGKAFQELMNAIRLDGKRFAPFPVGRYQPLRILGAGGFGVAFLCQHKFMNANVVVKTIITEGTDSNADKVFTEAQLLTQLRHPTIIGIADCGYADPAAKSRPYLVMDYFEGLTLEEYIEQKGPLHPHDLWLLVNQLGEGLQDAHEHGILHRDIKPANILVRRDDDDGWEAKIIDFGLALKQDILQQASTIRSVDSRSTMDQSLAGTLDYAAPEQIGRFQGVSVGTYSDVYSFGKTCCYALFKTTQPLPQHWQQLKRPKLANWLGKMLAEDPRERYGDFEAVLDKLPKINKPPKRRAKKDTDEIGTVSAGAGPAVQVATKVRLKVVRGQKPNACYLLREGAYVIGRTVDLDEYVNQLMTTMDRNKDGRISREEAKGYRLAEVFDQIDINKDGTIAKEELRKAAGIWFGTQNKPVNIDLKDQDAPGKSSCSREHARITFRKGEATIEDLNSRNGTFVNREKLNPGEKRTLTDEDSIQIGQIHLEVELE